MNNTISEYPKYFTHQKRKTITMYLKSKEIKEVVTECGEAACLLYQYYVSKVGAKSFEYTDVKSAAYFGWKPSKAKALRLKLIKANLFRQDVGTLASGRKTVFTYLGKDIIESRFVATVEDVVVPSTDYVEVDEDSV